MTEWAGRLSCTLLVIELDFSGCYHFQSWVNINIDSFVTITSSLTVLLCTWPHFSPICWLSVRTMTRLTLQWSQWPIWPPLFEATNQVGILIECYLDVWWAQCSAANCVAGKAALANESLRHSIVLFSFAMTALAWWDQIGAHRSIFGLPGFSCTFFCVFVCFRLTRLYLALTLLAFSSSIC